MWPANVGCSINLSFIHLVLSQFWFLLHTANVVLGYDFATRFGSGEIFGAVGQLYDCILEKMGFFRFHSADIFLTRLQPRPQKKRSDWGQSLWHQLELHLVYSGLVQPQASQFAKLWRQVENNRANEIAEHIIRVDMSREWDHFSKYICSLILPVAVFDVTSLSNLQGGVSTLVNLVAITSISSPYHDFWIRQLWRVTALFSSCCSCPKIAKQDNSEPTKGCIKFTSSLSLLFIDQHLLAHHWHLVSDEIMFP